MWIETLAITSVVVFGVYCYWYFFVAKTVQPITKEEVDLGWKLHKKQSGCTESRIKDLLNDRGGVVGFRCECGYEFKQKRLITQEARKLDSSVECSVGSDSSETEIQLERS